MADIRRFTGFIAPDGTTHDTIKKATEYTRDLKVKEALSEFAAAPIGNGVSETDRGGAVIYVGDIPEFLLFYKDKIKTAYNQDVVMRAPRKPKPEPIQVRPLKTRAHVPVLSHTPVSTHTEALIDLDD